MWLLCLVIFPVFTRNLHADRAWKCFRCYCVLLYLYSMILFAATLSICNCSTEYAKGRLKSLENCVFTMHWSVTCYADEQDLNLGTNISAFLHGRHWFDAEYWNRSQILISFLPENSIRRHESMQCAPYQSLENYCMIKMCFILWICEYWILASLAIYWLRMQSVLLSTCGHVPHFSRSYGTPMHVNARQYSLKKYEKRIIINLCSILLYLPLTEINEQD